MQCKEPLKSLKTQIVSNTAQCVGADSLFKTVSMVGGKGVSIKVGVIGQCCIYISFIFFYFAVLVKL